MFESFNSLLFYFSLPCLLLGCASTKGNLASNQNPPGTVPIAENLFVDQNELSILDYREYLSWLEKAHSASSFIFRIAQPDSIILNNLIQKHYKKDLPESLVVQMDNYPIVGITYSQAIDYAKWRTDRVLQSLLIKKKILSYNPDDKETFLFTKEDYLAGKWGTDHTGFPISSPNYQLPTEKQWEMIGESTKIDRKNNGNQLKKCVSSKKEKIYNYYGNVAEMINKEGVAKGGSWKNDAKTQTYINSNDWLGVRFVANYTNLPKNN